MGSPHVHEFMELLPLQPSSTNIALPLSLSTSSCTTQTDVVGSYRFSRIHVGSCIDVNQMPSSSEKQDELSSIDIPFTLGLSQDTKLRSQNGRQHPSTRSGALGRMHPESYTNASNFEHERTPNGLSPHVSEEEEGGSIGGSITRKKLRLSKEESSLLEERFKEHSTLNPKQKNALAKQLNLRPRQVEVWFQNRRARTKLKQIEVDCEMLKRCCDSLTEENMRLQREVAELRELKAGGPSCTVIPHDFCKPLPAVATLRMCPSCEHLAPCGPTAPARSSSTTTSISSFCQQPSISPQQQPSSTACN